MYLMQCLLKIGKDFPPTYLSLVFSFLCRVCSGLTNLRTSFALDFM